MPYYKIAFLTLNAVRIKDSLYCANILTDKNGRLSARVNGVGKPKSRFAKFINPGLLCSGIVYLSRESGSLIITDAEIIDEFSHLKNSLDGLNCLAFITSLISDLTAEKFKIRGLFYDTVNYFRMRDCAELGKINLYRLYILNKLGYLPDLKFCNICGSEFISDFRLDIISKEIICSECLKNCRLTAADYKNRNDIFTADFLGYCRQLLKLLTAGKLPEYYGFSAENNQKTLEKFIKIFIMDIKRNCQNRYELLKSI